MKISTYLKRNSQDEFHLKNSICKTEVSQLAQVTYREDVAEEGGENKKAS